MLGQEQRPLAGSGLREPARGHCPAKALLCQSGKPRAAAQLFYFIFPPSPHPCLPPLDSFLELEEYTFREALELSGTPFPYFPEMIPQASGDHVIAPTPTKGKKTNFKSCLCKLGSKVWWCLSRTWLVMGESWPAKKSLYQHLSFCSSLGIYELCFIFYKPIKHTPSVTESRPY